MCVPVFSNVVWYAVSTIFELSRFERCSDIMCNDMFLTIVRMWLIYLSTDVDVVLASKPVWILMINALNCLILRFLLLLKPTRESLFDIISRDHGRATVKEIFNLIADEKKKVKCDLDINFLQTCKSSDIFPKFLRFKLYKKSLQNSQLYRKWQNELLDQELNFKKGRQRELDRSRTDKRRLLYQKLTLFQYFWLTTEVRDTVSTYARKHEVIHARKLQRLGISSAIRPCDPDH